MSAYNALFYDTTSKEVIHGPLPYYPSGTQYSDYLFWDNATSQWTLGSSTVHLGSNAGQTLQGASSVAIGPNAGQNIQGAGTVVPLASVASVARVGSTSTIRTSNPHNLVTGQVVSISVSSPNDGFNANNVTITASISDPFEFSYTQVGLAVSPTSATGTIVGAGQYAVAMGPWAGQTEQSNGSVAIGYAAGSNYQSGFTTTVGGGISQVARSSLVATITTASPHNLFVGQTIRVDCSIASFSAFDAEVTVVPTTTTFRYLQTSGSDLPATPATGTVFIRTAHAVAVGSYAGNSNQGGNAVAVGSNAAQANQGANAVAIGNNAGNSNQGASAIAIGNSAGNSNQGASAISIGVSAGRSNQQANAIAIGSNAGQTSQNQHGIAIGTSAGQLNQGLYAIALGLSSGRTIQSDYGIAIGANAAEFGQRINGIAIGTSAGQNTQGTSAIAIGNSAGTSAQPANTIILNASSIAFGVTSANATYIRPIRQGNSTRLMYYNPTTFEVLQDVNVRQSDPGAALNSGSGCIGEIRSNSGGAGGRSSGVWWSYASITVTPGLWMIWSSHEIGTVAPLNFIIRTNPSGSNITTMTSQTTIWSNSNSTGNITYNGTTPIPWLASSNQTFTAEVNIEYPVSSNYYIFHTITAIRFA
jgi:hypothetical protein